MTGNYNLSACAPKPAPSFPPLTAYPDGILRRLMSGSCRALHLVGVSDCRRVSLAGVEFLLEKVAATVIPIRLYLDNPGETAHCEGAVSAVWRDGTELHIQTQQGDLRLPLDPGHSAWVVPDSDGPGVCLAIFNHHQQYIARIYGQRPSCIAWHALVQWLALREDGSGLRQPGRARQARR